jgi:MoxR-like ATPase
LGFDAPETVLKQGAVQPVVTAEDLVKMREALKGITLREELVSYGVDVVRGTRLAESVLVGAGPRATQALLVASRAHAALQGRDFVTPDDIKIMATPVLEHRIVLRPEFEIEGVTIKEVIEKVVQGIAVPR